MGQFYHEEFRQKLLDIKARDVQFLAARMGRVLRDFPRKFAARSVSRVIDNEPVVLDRSGTVFDSVWNENVGSSLSVVTGITIDTAKDIISYLYSTASFLTKHLSVVYGEIEPGSDTSFASDLANWYQFGIDHSLINSDADYVDDNSHPKTYAALGFYLDQASLNEDEGRPYDVYEFCKDLSTTDIWGKLVTLRSIVESSKYEEGHLQESHKQAIADVMWLTELVVSMFLDMAHLIDGFSTCARLNGNVISNTAEPEDVTDAGDFDPTTDPEYQRIIMPASVAASTTVQLSKQAEESYTLAFKLTYPYRLKSIEIIDAGNNSEEVDFEVTSFNMATNNNGYGIFISEKFALDGTKKIRYVVDTGSGSFVSSKIRAFIRRNISAGSASSEDITVTRL